MQRMKTKTTLRLAINELLEDLGAEDDESVIVTIVLVLGPMVSPLVELRSSLFPIDPTFRFLSIIYPSRVFRNQ